MCGLCEDCDEYCMCCVGYVRTVMNTVLCGLCEDCDEYCMCVGYVRTVMNTVCVWVM